MSRQSDAYRALPAIEKLLNREELSGFTSVAELAYVKREARSQVEQLRSQIALNDPETIAWVIESDVQKEICQKIIVSLANRSPGTLKAVFNLTGTVIHTNLGEPGCPSKRLRPWKSLPWVMSISNMIWSLAAEVTEMHTLKSCLLT